MKKRVLSPVLVRYNSKKTKISVEDRTIDFEVGLHWHDYIELEIVTSGTGYHIFNGDEAPFEKGTVILCHNTDYHYIMPNDTVKISNISFGQSVISEKISRKLDSLTHGLCFNLDEDTYSTVLDLFKILLKEKEVTKENLAYTVNLIECILMKIFEKAEQPMEEAPLKAMQQAILYLHSHFTENPSLEEIAKKFHYHPKHFCTAFHKKTEVKYSEYLSRLKADYASTLLSTTDYDIEHICSMSGFGSMVNFRRVFKEFFGVTPLKYRQKKREMFEKLPNIGLKNKTSAKNEKIM